MKNLLELIHHLCDTLKHKLLKLLDLFDSALMLLGSYTLAQYKDFLGILGLVITMSYTIWKWRKEYLEFKTKK